MPAFTDNSIAKKRYVNGGFYYESNGNCSENR